MNLRSDLVKGFAALLAAECDPAQLVTWQPDGSAYADDATGVFLRKVPASPDRIVSLSLYDIGDDATYDDSTIGLQCRSRGAGQDPTEVDDLDSAVSDVLVGRWPVTVGGVHVITLERTSGVSLGQDPSKRWERVSNFTLGCSMPGSHRL